MTEFTAERIAELETIIADIIDDMANWTCCDDCEPHWMEYGHREKRIKSIAHIVLHSVIGEMALAKEI